MHTLLEDLQKSCSALEGLALSLKNECDTHQPRQDSSHHWNSFFDLLAHTKETALSIQQEAQAKDHSLENTLKGYLRQNESLISTVRQQVRKWDVDATSKQADDHVKILETEVQNLRQENHKLRLETEVQNLRQENQRLRQSIPDKNTPPEKTQPEKRPEKRPATEQHPAAQHPSERSPVQAPTSWSTFIDQVSERMLVDGVFQRFKDFVVEDKDKWMEGLLLLMPVVLDDEKWETIEDVKIQGMKSGRYCLRFVLSKGPDDAWVTYSTCVCSSQGHQVCWKLAPRRKPWPTVLRLSSHALTA